MRRAPSLLPLALPARDRNGPRFVERCSTDANSPAALSNLACASLKEDPYGVAQRDIPKVLEAFVRYLSVLDSLASELQGMAEKMPGGPAEKEKARRVVEQEIGEVQEGELLRLSLTCLRSAPRDARRAEMIC